MSESKTLVRTKADALDDAAPNATLPPETEVWHAGSTLPGFSGVMPVRGFSAVLEFTTPLGNSCDVTVWKRNEARREEGLAAWKEAGTLVGVTSDFEFFDDETGAADIYLQITNVSAGNPVAVRMSPRS